MNILIVEDDLNKLKNLKEFIENYFLDKKIEYSLEIKNSYQSGLESILTNDYNLLLLDMSLPNWDYDETNTSNTPLAKGGELILYEMDVMGINITTIIVTQHDDFDGESLESIHNEYMHKFSTFYIGYIFYNAIESNWKDDLEMRLDGVLND